MSAPNIVGVTTIYGKTSPLNVTTTPTAIVDNSGSSGKVLKINSLIVANVDGTYSADISAYIYRTTGTLTVYVAKTITVPADATMILVAKESGFYLEEGDSLYVVASANSKLDAVCSYEDIS